jgi:hypothetical protein
MFYKKSVSKTFAQNNPRNFDVSFSSASLVFGSIAFSGVSQRWEFENTTKSVYKKVVPKSFYKKIDKKSPNLQTLGPNRFFLGFGFHVLRHFLVRGGAKKAIFVFREINN